MKTCLIAAALVSCAAAASAHATLETTEAPINSTYKAVVRVGHGCEGEATLKLRVRVPEGMIAVKPLPQAGWDVETVSGPYARSYTLWGAEVAEGVTEIVWTGELLDAHYDEFTFRGFISDALPAGETLYVPVVQECATKAERWIEIPAAGQSAHDLASPAPGVLLTAPVTS
jgi:uncharacterized protein YcnI